MIFWPTLPFTSDPDTVGPVDKKTNVGVEHSACKNILHDLIPAILQTPPGVAGSGSPQIDVNPSRTDEVRDNDQASDLFRMCL